MNVSAGVVGAGGFSMFSVDAFLENDSISVGGVFDVDVERAKAFAEKYEARVFETFPGMLRERDIDLIYIATPPNLHYEQSKAALEAGKHVICEKPAALRPEHAEEVERLAEEKGLLYVVNLMQRYNPLYQKVSELIFSEILGGFLHGYFENYASDENLGPGHWMWDHSISGGKFIEHAVHFFDMFEGWLGEGKHIASQKVRRPGFKKDYYSRVQSTGFYRGGLVNMYHGFDQPGRFDRQELRLLFERGDVTLYEWVPVRAEINALVNEEQQEQLVNLFPGAEMTVIEKYHGADRSCRGNFKEYEVDARIKLEYGKNARKENIYRQILRDMLNDQLKWINDPGHKRIITGKNGVNSLKMAWEAEKNAQHI